MRDYPATFTRKRVIYEECTIMITAKNASVACDKAIALEKRKKTYRALPWQITDERTCTNYSGISVPINP